MDILGTNFHTEINKFKFLNELVSNDYVHKAFFSAITIDFSRFFFFQQIRLVSKKFLGDKTPLEIQNRVSNVTSSMTNYN